MTIAAAIPLAMAQTVPECADGVDNDNDGGTDWLGTAAGSFNDWDQECTWPGDPSEGGDTPNSCPHPTTAHSHIYGAIKPGGALLTQKDVTVFDTNTQDCDGDNFRDFDGDYDSGVGGAFFGYGPYANEPVCNYGLKTHGNTIQSLQDVTFGSDIWFVLGADDTGGPVVTTDPDTGETSCETNGSITPGDPATDPTADADDCLTSPMNIAQGVGAPYATCGAGGDGGYWVFLDCYWVLVCDPSGCYFVLVCNCNFANPPTHGVITA